MSLRSIITRMLGGSSDAAVNKIDQVPIRIFRDDALQKQFEADGYVVVPFLSEAETNELLQAYQQLDSGVRQGFYSSLFSKSSEYKKLADAAIQKTAADKALRWLVDFEPLVGNFVVKLPDVHSELPLHKDWKMVDETRFRSINFWFPLTPLSPQTGLVQVVKGSHLYLNDYLRGSPAFPTPIDGIQEPILQQFMTTPSVKLGEVMIHDNALLHYSGVNKTANDRVAVCLNMIPAAAAPLHYYQHPGGVATEYEVPKSFFTEFNIGDEPKGKVRQQWNNYTCQPIGFDAYRQLHLLAQ